MHVYTPCISCNGDAERRETVEGPCKPSVPPLLFRTELASAISSTWVGFATDATWTAQRKSDTSTFVYPNFLLHVKVGSKAKSQNSMTNVRSERMIPKMTDGAKNLGDK